MSEKGEMSFLDHVEALRWHLARIMVALVVGFSIAMYYTKEIFENIVFAPARTDFVTFRWLCKLGEQIHMQGLCVENIPMKIQSRFLMGQFTMQLTSAIFGALIIAFPYIIWEIWRFVKPGLYKREQRNAQGIVLFSSTLFLIGIAFGYFVMCPMSIAFLANYSISDMISNEFDITSYVSTVTTLVFGCGLLFQLPVIVFFLTKLGLLTHRIMQHYRRHAVVVILIIGAIVTPTSDPFTLTLVSVPLYILFEISIVLSAYELRQMQRREQRTA